jgi:uncharacterized phage protein (TIGR01671 family)
MREIKFRAFDKEGNIYPPDQPPSKMYYQEDFKKTFGNSLTHYYSKEHGRFLVSEFTGLKDRNGKEIYEGDRVDSGGFKGVVTYEPQGAIWIIKSERHKDLASSAQYGDERGIFLLDVFVEGNIYENPELLK